MILLTTRKNLMGPFVKTNVNDFHAAGRTWEVVGALTQMKATTSLTFKNTDMTCSSCCIASRNLDMRDMPRSFFADPC